MLLRALVTFAVVSCALPGYGREHRNANGTPRSGQSAFTRANSVSAQNGDDYAHVFYEFSATRGVRLFIRAAGGGARDITTEPEWQSRHKEALERLRRKRRDDYVQAHTEMDPTLRDAVTAGILRQGMTTEQVRACVGDAASESRTLAREGLVEVWRYSIPPLATTGELSILEGEDVCGKGKFLRRGRECVLYFRDGVLVSWETPDGAQADAKASHPR